MEFYFVLVLQISELFLGFVDVGFEVVFLFHDFLLGFDVLLEFLLLDFQSFGRLNQLFLFFFDLLQQTLVGLLGIPQLLNLMPKLFNQIQIRRRNLGIVRLNIGILLIMLSRQLLNLLILLLLQILYRLHPKLLHLPPNILNLLLELLLQIPHLPLKLLPQLRPPPIILGLHRKQIIAIRQFLFFEVDVEGADIGLQLTLFYAVLLLELFEGDLDVFAQFGLLVLVLE